jgi:hypothetical protein
MAEISIEQVIRSLSTSELMDAVETFLDHEDMGQSVWPVLNELERRDALFEI